MFILLFRNDGNEMDFIKFEKEVFFVIFSMLLKGK